MKMDIIKELNLLIQMHYSGDIDSRDEWLREIIYLKSRFESKVNNVVLDDVSKQGELLKAFVDFYNYRNTGDKIINNDEIEIFIDSL